MGYTETPKTSDYIGVATTEPPQGSNVYTLPAGAAVGEPVPPQPFDVISARQMKKMAKKQKKMEKKEKKKKKKRGSMLLCCSSFEIDDEEGKEKVREMLESERRRISLMMCCSNFEVGSKRDYGFGK